MMGRFLCWLLGHEYRVYAKPVGSVGIRWLKCKRCGRSFVIDDMNHAILDMDFELLDMHKWQVLGQGTGRS